MLGIALFSGMDAVMKGLVLALGTYATLLWRSFAGVAIAGALFAANRPKWPSRATLNIHLTRGAVSTLMGVLFFWGLARVPLAQAIALAFIAPLVALMLAAVMLGEKIAKRTVAASLIAFAGVAIIFVGQAQADLGRAALLGSLAILVSAILYALNIILMRRQSLAAGPAEAAFYQNLTVSVLLLAALPVLGTSAARGDPLAVAAVRRLPLDHFALIAVMGLRPRRGELPRRDRIYVLPVGDGARLAGVRRNASRRSRSPARR